MSTPRLFLSFLSVLLVASVAFVGVRRVTTDDTDPPAAGRLPDKHDCGLPIERYDQETLHEAYEMTLRMSEPDASPMWDDEQLRLSLEDPRFVAELERHFCRMEGMADG